MKDFCIRESGIYAGFLIRDNGTVELTHFTYEGDKALKEVLPKETIYHPILEIQETGKSSRELHGYKHNVCSASLDYKYQGHTLLENDWGRLLTISLASDYGVTASYHMQFFSGIPVVQIWTVLENKGNEAVPLEYVSSFMFQNICGEGQLPYTEKTDIYIPRNSWCCEARWQKCDARELNLSGMLTRGYNSPGTGMNEFSYDGKSSWSTVNFLPMGLISDRETGATWCFQIEHSGQWHVEYGSDFGGRLFLALSGATEGEHGWWYSLKPGDKYRTIPVAFGVVNGGVDEAIGALTRYRRAIRRPNYDSVRLLVVFNDYMNCLMGDPYEDTEMKIIDKAAEIGCEYYCMDCGWYDKGYWWDRVGEWVESPERFPNGLRKVFDYARSKGLKMGMWLEIEVMGIACELAGRLPDDWFVCRHGKRHIDNKRYLLDFRNPEVRKYCGKVIDRLVDTYGCEYFKIDYNVSMGYGSDLGTDSCAEAIRQHYEGLYAWYRDVFRRHPQLVIENCGSGGMRMDYGMLKLLSLQSTSDQTDYLWNSYIATNIATAVTPEQAGMWVYPYVDDREHVIYNFVNGLLLRPYVSGLVWDMSDDNLKLMAEGIALYKKIRGQFPSMVRFFPLGLNRTETDKVLAYGLKNESRAYLAVLTPHAREADIPLHFGSHETKDELRDEIKIEVIYPGTGDCDYRLDGSTLHVTMPQEACGRLFKLEL